MVSVKQTSNPCFCRRGCPPGSRPHKKWAIRLLNPGLLTEYTDHKLYVIDEEGGAFCGCTYLPSDPSSGYTTENLCWDVQTVPQPGDTEYPVKLFLRKTPGPAREWGHLFSWTEEELPLDDDDIRLCNTAKNLAEIPGTSSAALLSPAPEWVCDDVQLRAWCDSTDACT